MIFQFIIKSRRGIRGTFLIILCGILFVGYSGVIPVSNSVGSNQTFIIDIESPEEKFESSALDYSALWNRTYGGFHSDRTLDLVLCEDDGYALVGYTESFAANRDTWIIRTDKEGNVEWTTTLDNNGTVDFGNSIYQCENGDFVVAGSFATVGGTNGFIARIDNNGNLLWTYEIGIEALTDNLVDVIEASNGAIVAIGTTESWGAGLDDVLVVSLSPMGSPVWTRTYGSIDDDIGRSIIESRGGGFALLATTYSYGAGSSDFWLVRIDVNGNVLWDEPYGSTLGESAYDIIENYPSGYVMVGQTKSFGDTQGDIYVVRVDADGGLIWEEDYSGSGEDFATGIVESVRGGFAIISIADYIGVNPQTRITRIQLDNTEIWSNWYGGIDVDYGYEIVEISPEEYVVGGTTRSFGSGNFDAWIFLVPGLPEIIDAPSDLYFEFGDYAGVFVQVESSTPIDTWWLVDTSVFNVVPLSDYEAVVYAPLGTDVDFYEIYLNINNTAGHEIEHIFSIHIDDTTAPSWSDYTAEQFLEFGDQFQYTPVAYDLSLLDEWFLTGSAYFDINISNGEIFNVGTPPVGEYNLEIQVNDRYHNSLVDILQIVVQDTTAPTWDTTLQDQSINYGVNFVYNLNASDLAGIASWSVDNDEFSIDSKGRIRNMITLAPGEHTITVTVTDVNGNDLTGTFSVLVGDAPAVTTSTILDSAIPFAFGVAATLAVGAVVCVIGRRKPSAK